MRIAMVAACPFPSPQGSQVFVGQMCERLAARGHDVHLLTYGEGREVRGRGFEHHRARRVPGDRAMRSGPTMAKPVLDALMVASLDKLLRRRDFDVLHCHNYEAAIVGLAVRAWRGVPVVYHSHNLMGDELGTYFRGGLSKALAAAAGRFLDASVPRRVDHAIALCDYSKSVLLAHGVTAERISVIPPAVDDDEPACSKAEARARLGLPGQGFVVGYCGNLDAYQNLTTLLDAVAAMRSECCALQPTLLAATHAADHDFEAAVSERDLGSAVVLTELGDYEQARVAMAAADVLVLPRRHGSGYPVKLLNYMTMHRPIVAAGCGGKVLTDGVDGLVVADDDPAALATALRRLAADDALARRLADGARRRFLTTLTWESVLPAIESVHARVVGAKWTPKTAHAV